MERCRVLIVASLSALALVCGTAGCAFTGDGDVRLEPLTPNPWFGTEHGNAVSGQRWPLLPDAAPLTEVTP